MTKSFTGLCCVNLNDFDNYGHKRDLEDYAKAIEEFDVEIPTVEIIPSNFNSAKSIWALIEKLKEQ